MSTIRCIPELLAKGELPADRAEEITGLYDELHRVYRRQFGDQAASAMASEATLRQLRVQAAQKKRLAMLQAQAQSGFRKNIASFDGYDGRGPIPPRAVQAFFDADGRAPWSNVEARRKAIKGRAHAYIDQILADHHRDVLGRVRSPAELANIVREVFKPGSTQDPAAAELAAAWLRSTEMLRGRFNAAGGHIGKLEGGYMPQSHDSRAVRKAGYPASRDFISPLLDRSRVVDEPTGAPFTDQALELALKDVYEKIRTDGWSAITPGAIGGKMLANQRAEHRFLHFTDADAWMAYAEKFGSGSPYDAMMSHIDAMSRDTAAMEILGPNPSASVAYLKDLLERSHALSAEGGEAGTKGAKQVQRLWDEYTGQLNRPESRALALGFGTVRNLQSAAKLGSATLSSVSDLATGAVTRAYNGLPVAPMIWHYAKLLRPGSIEDQKLAVRAGLIAEEWSSMSAAAHRMMLQEYGADVSRRLANGVLTVSGLARWTQAGRWAFGMEFTGFLTDHVGQAFDDLPSRLQAQMRRYGLGPDAWDRIRATPLQEDRGTHWLYPQNVQDRELGDRLLEMIQTEADYAVPVPDLRTRALMHGVAPAGTWMGEIVRSALLFKSFGISVALLHGRRIMEMSPAGAAAYAAALVIGSTAMGALAVQLKQLAGSKDLRDMTGAQAPAFWGSAMAQGGGWGIYGDFLASAENRFGGGIVSTLAGPMADPAQTVADLTVGEAARAVRRHLGTGDVAENRSHAGADLVSLVRRETPGGNLWYTRQAFQRAIADQLQAAVDPNYRESWRRMEQRAREQGGEFYWEPGEVAPQRAPRLSSAVGGGNR